MSDDDFSDWATGELTRIANGTSVHRPSPNQSFYKYISLNTKTSWGHLERTLNECALIGSTVHSLNDPFEGRACTFDDLHTMKHGSWLSGGFSQNPLAGQLVTEEKQLAEWREQALAYLAKQAEIQRIVSFCERSDSPLLWSHYANSYQGACLHFLGRAFSPISRRLGYVRYTNTRPDYPLRLALGLARRRNTSDVAESDKILFFTKALDWAYEAEIRLIYNSNEKSANRFEPTGLLSIILGPNMNAEDEARLQETVSSSKCTHIQIRRARLSENAFAIEIQRDDGVRARPPG
jgi:hypothetical protein